MNDDSTVAQLDFWMNIAGGMIAMFIIAFVLISNEKTKKSDEGIQPKADFLITLDWDPKSPNDIDLWVRDPNGEIVGYRRPSVPGMFLDRDDTGTTHDYILNADGTKTLIEINQEVVTIRGYRPGRYTINVHYYAQKGPQSIDKVSLKVIKLQPFGYAYEKKEFILDREGQEKTIVTFEVDKDGKVISIDETPDLFVHRNAR